MALRTPDYSGGMTMKICAECAHCVVEWSGQRVIEIPKHRCHHPKANGRRNYVTGAWPEAGGIRCCRSLCGPDGAWYEPKEE